MTKKDIVKKVIGTGVGLGLGALTVVNGQDYSKIEKGVNAPIVTGETPTHVIYHYNFNKDLQRAIKNSKNPQVYLTGDKNSYILVNPDNSGFDLYYFKENYDASGNGKKTVLWGVNGDEHKNPCDNTGLGSKTNSLVSSYDTPSRVLSEPQKESAPKESISEPVSNYNQTIINKDSHDIYNYFYGDTAKTKEAQQKLSSLELRALIEGTKSFDVDRKFMNNIEGISANPQIVFGPVGIGPYVKYNIGNRKSSVITNVYEKRLLNQALDLSTETEGVEIEDSNTKHPFEFGGVLSLNLTKDGRLRFDMSYGKVNKKRITSGVHAFGFDRKLQGDEVIINDKGEREEKPYDFTSGEGTTYNNLEDIQKISINGEPFPNSGFYLGLEGQYIGKLNAANLKKENLSVNAKAGWRIGGGKKSK